MLGSWLFWAILSALFAALTAILAKVGVSGVDSNLASAVRTTFALAFAWLLALAVSTQSVRDIRLSTWIFLALSGLATGASWLCYFRALQLGPASQVAPVDKLSVVLVMILGVVVLHEPLSWKHWLGGLLIVAGVVLIATVKSAPVGPEKALESPVDSATLEARPPPPNPAS